MIAGPRSCTGVDDLGQSTPVTSASRLDYISLISQRRHEPRPSAESSLLSQDSRASRLYTARQTACRPCNVPTMMIYFSTVGSCRITSSDRLRCTLRNATKNEIGRWAECVIFGLDVAVTVATGSITAAAQIKRTIVCARWRQCAPPPLTRGYLGPHESAPYRQLDLFCRFCKCHGSYQHTDNATQSVAISCIRYACDAA